MPGKSVRPPFDPSLHHMPRSDIRLSLIVPVYNNPRDLRECLDALTASCPAGSEIIVVDDGSTDDTAAVAAATGARVIRLPVNSGPAAARNCGAHQARGDLLFFIDADVVVAPDVLGRVRRLFDECPDLSAVFGSYDARPRADNVVSRYRNLLHHYVHQQGNPAAATFWAGCGAIRRAVFVEVGGFDAEWFPHPSIEDIELGYRLRAAGHRVLLDRTLQGTHLKRWTLPSLLRTDITRRALPWSRLILASGNAPDDLNLTGAQRLSAALVALGGLGLPLALLRPESLVVVGVALLGIILLNRGLYALFLRHGGPLFAAAGVLLHLVYFAYSGFSYLYAWAEFRLRGTVRPAPRQTPTASYPASDPPAGACPARSEGPRVLSP